MQDPHSLPPEVRTAAFREWSASCAHSLDISNFLTAAFSYDTCVVWQTGKGRPGAPDDTVYALTNACLDYLNDGHDHPDLQKLGRFLGHGLFAPGHTEETATRLVHRIARLFREDVDPRFQPDEPDLVTEGTYYENSADAFAAALDAHCDGGLEAHFAQHYHGIETEYARTLYPPLGRKNEWSNTNRYGYR